MENTTATNAAAVVTTTGESSEQTPSKKSHFAHSADLLSRRSAESFMEKEQGAATKLALLTENKLTCGLHSAKIKRGNRQKKEAEKCQNT